MSVLQCALNGRQCLQLHFILVRYSLAKTPKTCCLTNVNVSAMKAAQSILALKKTVEMRTLDGCRLNKPG